MVDRNRISTELARLAAELEGEAGDVADVVRVAELALRRDEVLRTCLGT